MSFKSCFNLLILLPFLLGSSQSAFSYIAQGHCGKYLFLVKMIHELDMPEWRFVLYYKAKNQSRNMFFKTKAGVYLSAGCIQNKEKKDLLIFNEFYGGNVGPEDIYGVFDPSTQKMLIKPANLPIGNSKQVEKIIGFPPPRLDENDKSAFCCSSHQYQMAENP